MESIDKIINAYPDEYIAIKKQARKYAFNDSRIGTNCVVNILHRPWEAPLNWGLMLYKGAEQKWINEAEQTIQKAIPDFYKQFLLNINGCFVYDISLFGLIHSLTRSFLQCHDLTTANSTWIAGFKVDQSYFHFGGGTYSYKENTGYFYGGGKIISIRKNGKLINEWSNFTEFLNDEIGNAEKKMLKEIPKNIKLIITE